MDQEKNESLTLVEEMLGMDWTFMHPQKDLSMRGYSYREMPTNFQTETMERWAAHQTPVSRPEWDDYFMTIAMLAATRSCDAQWQAGAVLVKDKHILGTGYNSFPSDLPDSLLPNLRPAKYPLIIHAERNAIDNCTVEDLKGATCYTNGMPCLECLKGLHSNGVRDIRITKGKSTMVQGYTDDEKAAYLILVEYGGISFQLMDTNDSTLIKAGQILEKST